MNVRLITVLVLVLVLAGLNFCVHAAKLHVAQNGADDNTGTIEKPLGTLSRAIELSEANRTANEIIIQHGRYFISVNINQPKLPEGQMPAPLRISAAEGEEVVFDGSDPMQNAVPLEGTPGAFTLKGEFGKQVPAAWESAKRLRYTPVFDLAAVRAFPASLTLLDATTIAIHTSDGRAPTTVGTRLSRFQNGIFSTRDNLSISGLHFENYLTWEFSAGVTVHSGKNVTIENCTARNCARGFVASHGGCDDVRFMNCEAHDVGIGIYSEGNNTTVQGCRLTKNCDGYAPRVYKQDDTGIEFYSPATGGACRFNFVSGFVNGIFIKATPALYIVENNTLLNGEVGTFNNTWRADNTYRRNVIVNFDVALLSPEKLKAGGVFDENIVWSEAKKTASETNLAEVRAAGGGTGNLFADPRFAAEEKGDYRVLSNSPALKMGENQTPVGAFGVVPAGFVNPNPPRLKIAPRAPVVAEGAFGKLFADRDAWIGGGRTAMGDLKGSESTTYLTASRRVTLDLDARHSTSAITRIKIETDKAAPREAAFQSPLELELPDADGPHRIGIRVQNQSGQWSKAEELQITLARKAPRILGTPQVATSEHGVVVTFATDRPAIIEGEIIESGAAERTPNASVERTYDANRGEQDVEEWITPHAAHVVALPLTAGEAGKTYRYRLKISDQAGNLAPVWVGTFVARGAAQVLHVAPNTKSSGDGTTLKPLASIQDAVDRALPGDTILLAPGFYSEEVYLGRGGIQGAPITIEADQPNTVILDGRRQINSLIHLENAPYVSIRNLNLRWFGSAGVRAYKSPHAVVSNCRFVNDFPSAGFTTGSAIWVRESPDGTFDHNAATLMETGLYLLHSPQATVTHNSATRLMYGGLTLIDSCRDSVVKNNSYCWAGNDMVYIQESQPKNFASLVLDYNNYACNPRDLPVIFKSTRPYIQERSGYAMIGASIGEEYNLKRFNTLDEWRKFSGKDAHTIFSDPLWVDPFRGRWEVEKDSPNIDAGENGATIGDSGLCKHQIE